MDKLQEIKEKTEFNHFHMPEEGRFSLAFNLRKDDFDWLIQTIEQQQEEIEQYKKFVKIKESHEQQANNILLLVEQQLKEANTRIQFLEGLRSAQA